MAFWERMLALDRQRSVDALHGPGIDESDLQAYSWRNIEDQRGSRDRINPDDDRYQRLIDSGWEPTESPNLWQKRWADGTVSYLPTSAILSDWRDDEEPGLSTYDIRRP